MRCSSDVLKKTSPLDVFGDVSEKVKHLTNDVSPPALSLKGGYMVVTRWLQVGFVLFMGWLLVPYVLVTGW